MIRGSNASSVQGQQLMDLENKLKVAKDELEKAALDKVRPDHSSSALLFFSSAIF